MSQLTEVGDQIAIPVKYRKPNARRVEAVLPCRAI